MTVEKLRNLLNEEVEKGNGHMPVAIQLDGVNFNGCSIRFTLGLDKPVKIGLTEKHDKIWIIGKMKD